MEYREFVEEAWRATADLRMRSQLAFNINQYEKKVYGEGLRQFVDLEGARKWASAVRGWSVRNVRALLEEFESSATENGITVLWARDASEACGLIEDILRGEGCRRIVKAKSATTEEINLRGYLSGRGFELWETDLGAFLVSLTDRRPFHFVTPAMHLSRREAAKVFHERFGTPPDATAEELARFARQFLREKFLTADAGITGANFLLAREGAVVLTENEGNIRLCVSLPRVHIVVAGIEKVIPSVEYLVPFLRLLAAHGTGQFLTSYNTVVRGPAGEGAPTGPRRMYVVLLDNGRTRLINSRQWEAAACIRCGACLNACPVYRVVGGYTYPHIYGGPIGKVVVPVMFLENRWLAHASSLCHRCDEVCPVGIPISRLIHSLRGGNFLHWWEGVFWRVWGWFMRKPFLIEVMPYFVRRVVLGAIFRWMWKPRAPLPVPRYTFRRWWRVVMQEMGK